MVKPFSIMKDLPKLVETFKSYNTIAEEMVGRLEEASEPYLKAFRRREHYNEVARVYILSGLERKHDGIVFFSCGS